MSKIIFWVVVIFAAFFALRMYNVAKSRVRRKPENSPPGPAAPEAMVRCAGCGVFLPRADASAASDGYHCTDPKCVGRNPRSR